MSDQPSWEIDDTALWQRVVNRAREEGIDVAAMVQRAIDNLMSATTLIQLPEPDEEPRGVDAFIDGHGPDDTRELSYARWMLHHFRMPAVWRMHFAPFIEGRRLFCTWQGQRFRVTGASRLGDIWLAADFDRDCGYDQRVDVEACSAWGAEP